MAENKPGLRGKTVIRPLDLVQPNDWNPNEVPEETMESIRRDFKTEGWLVSMALTVWGKDEKGVVQNRIIDGEHRWKAARDVGLVEGPMVFLDGLTRAQAAAITVKLDAKRGEFNIEKLAKVVAEIAAADETTDVVAEGERSMLSLELGIGDDEIDKLKAIAGEAVPPPAGTPPPPPPKVVTKKNCTCPKCGNVFEV